jgi:glycosyltransferase involved in cell wall biosynthesis
MAARPGPSISVVIGAYQAERFVAESLESILGQTRPPDEIVVVDDGSTDGTAAELEKFADRIRVVFQRNSGCPAAFNTAFREARGDFVALCGADDIWEPQKLEWQAEAILAHPDADVLFGHAVLFGRIEAEQIRPPGTGMLDSNPFRDALFRDNCVCAPTVLIRRSLFERLGPFVEQFGADDYEYWFRCLRAGARFYYDPRPLVRWRMHEGNLSARMAWMEECSHRVRRWYEGDVTDPTVVSEAVVPVLSKIARRLVDDGRLEEARQTYREVLHYARGKTTFGNTKVLAWVFVLGLPVGPRARAVALLLDYRRAVDGVVRMRQPAPS